MTRDNGNLSIDFLVGFTIFLLAFIWVVSMIPGLLIGLQAYTIDYDAVAYRTGVILVEDPGEPSLPLSPHSWESLNDTRDVVRLGLAVSKDTPNILSEKKITRFFCTTAFSYPDDYQQRAIFGDYPYRFNISLLDIERNKTLSVGDIMSPDSSYGSIRRLVKIKGVSSATINSTNLTYMNKYHFLNGDNETQHEFSILVNKTELLGGKVRDPIFQINPAKESITINITHVNSTFYADREKCFNINLTQITANTILFYDPIIDEVQYHVNTKSLYKTLPYVKNNISMIFDPEVIQWSWWDYNQIYINLTFNLVKNTTECPDSNPAYNFSGSRFLNNTFTSPFDYNYDPNNVTQSGLRDAVLEVEVGSGSRTATEKLIAQLAAAFKYEVTSGSPSITVKFTDQSTGSPVRWDWDFNNDGVVDSTLNNPTYNYGTSQGIKTVTLTVKDTNGVSASTTQTIDLSAPVAAFTANTTSGSSPLVVGFTDTTTGGTPTSWTWEYNKTVAGSWTQFSTARNPSYAFSDGIYDIRLTATNLFGSNTLTKTAFITATASHTITATAGAGGTIAPPGAVPVAYGANQAFTITPNASYYITDVVVDSVSQGAIPTYTFNNVVAAHTISASFAIYLYNITASAGSGGTITPSGTVGVNSGANQAFTITPNTGYHITDVVVDSISQGAIPTYTFSNVVANGHTISASFAINPPTVTGISPTTGPKAGGTTVTITGTGFTGATAVRFGVTAATPFTVNSDTSITATSPSGTGTVDITVTSPGGTSATSSADQYTYVNTRQQIFYDNFESGFTGWTIVGTVTNGTYTPRNGSYDIRLRAPTTTTNAQMTRAISTLGYSSVVVQFAWAAGSLESGESLYAEYSTNGGSSWTILTSITNTGTPSSLTVYSSALSAADNNANFQLRFRLAARNTGNNDNGYVDDVIVTGIPN